MSSFVNETAVESMFDAELTTAKLLEAVKANVANTVKTVDAATELENKLSEEAAQFNACLTTMSNAIRKCESGEISREEMLAECAPCVSALKEKCSALKLADVKTTGDDITEDEIAMLREYIVGCKDIVADRKQELQDCPVGCATEGIIAALTDFEPATEGQSWQAVKGFLGKSTRDARKAIKLGKAALKKGNKDDAVKYLSDAKKLFGEQKEQLQKLPKDMWDTISSWMGTGLIVLIYSFIGEGGYKDAPNKNVNVAAVINYLNRAIKKCDALIAQAKAGETEETEEAVESMLNFAVALESVYENLEEGEVEPATEASMAKEIRKSTESKTAAQLYKQAKKLYGLGSKEQALTYLKKAQKLYEGCLAKAEKEAKMYKAERKVKAGNITDTFDKKVTDSINFAYLIAYFEDRIDACKALELQWNNKAGKSTYKETKEQLKAERKEARAAKKAAKNAEKEAAKATESYEEAIDMDEATEALGMSVEAFIEAMESEMDAIEMEISIDAATEAEGDEAKAPKAAGLFGRIRGGLANMRDSKTRKERKDVAEDVKEAAKELEEAADAAETPEERKRLSKAAKGTLIALGTTAAAVGLYAIAKKCKQNSEKSGQDPKAVAKLIYNSVDAIDRAAAKVSGGVKGAVKSAGDAAASRRVGKAEAAAAKLASDKERADDHFLAEAEKNRQGQIDAINKAGAKYEKLKAKGKLGATESFLGSLAFGLESVLVEGEDVEEEKVEPVEGKAFDDEDLAEVAAEAAVAVMLAEDGIDDSDLD